MDITTFSIPEGFVIFGLLMLFSALVIGIEVGLDLLLIGSIIILGGFAGMLGDNYVVSLVVSSILSAFYLFYGRSKIKSKLQVNTHNTNVDKVKGEVGRATSAISPDKAGTVRIDDEDWRATSEEEILPGDKVRVSQISGVTVIVTKIK